MSFFFATDCAHRHVFLIQKYIRDLRGLFFEKEGNFCRHFDFFFFSIFPREEIF